ncbi:uncharacterized protein LOC129594162 isoform X2 [Paramacrobiotus metropolitanus]|uniref:uncharacterized protein LOC129594162 isoform X2 n=1 Tax=Paramacrobiotus metropolitanus TaxID=2943436 RepID=UPI0024457599|nr:uncharacterized protein LOC129594162 isoform X2 [Paramacrobiotus metropolitanus]
MSSRKKSARAKALTESKLSTLQQFFPDIAADVIQLTLEDCKGDMEKTMIILKEMDEELRKTLVKTPEVLSSELSETGTDVERNRLSDPNETIVLGDGYNCLPNMPQAQEITLLVDTTVPDEIRSTSSERSAQSVKFHAPLWQSDSSSCDKSQSTDIDYLESTSSSALEDSSSSGSRMMDKENRRSPFAWPADANPTGENDGFTSEINQLNDTVLGDEASDNNLAGNGESAFYSAPMSLQLDKDLACRLMMTFGLMQVSIDTNDSNNLTINLDMETAYRLYQAWKNTQEANAMQAEITDNSDEHLAKALQDLEHETYAEQDLKNRTMKEIMDETLALQLMEKESEYRGLDVASALMYQSDDGLQSRYAGVLLKSYNISSDSAFPPLDPRPKNVFANNFPQRSKDLGVLQKSLDDPPDGSPTRFPRPSSAGKVINVKPIGSNSAENVTNKGPKTDPVDYYGKRQKALELQQKALEYGARAGNAYKDQKLGGGAAAYYLQKAHEHKALSKQAHFQASLDILADRNSNVSDGEIDLHGLRMDEVGTALEDFFARKHKSKELKIIAGRGMHSRHGVSEVRRAVEIYLKKHDLTYVEGPPSGTFYVDKVQKLHARPP